MSSKITILPSMININGEYVPLASITPEQRAAKIKEYDERVERVVNQYCAAHPEVFDAICNYNAQKRA